MVMVLIKRRDLFKAAAIAVGASGKSGAADDTSRQINSVLGPLRPVDLGRTLIHEHVLVDIVGANGILRDDTMAEWYVASFCPT